MATKKTLKVAISYPPIVNERGQKAMVSQNRNVQYFKTPTYLLPVTYAQAATWLKQLKFKVRWDDGNAQLKTYEKWFSDLVKWNPDIVVFESTTPVMKFYWRLTDELKKKLPKTIFIMTGYHSMRKPEETLAMSKTDVVLKSNHVDFVLSRLLPYIRDHRDWRKNCDIEGLTIRVKGGEDRDTGSFRQVEPINRAPIINRDLVHWENYAYENGNYLQTPGTYATSVIRDCMFGKCTFCRYNGPELTFTKMKVEKSVDEYEMLISKYGVKEIFDDTGTFPIGPWLKEFCQGMIERDYNKKIKFSCNMRAKALNQAEYNLMAKAGFRFILYGLESGNQETLDLLNKGTKVSDIKIAARMAKKAGLMPHLTVMMGYPWETLDEAKKTVALAKEIMDHGWADSLQATIVIPYPGTRLFKECEANDWLTTKDWKDYDMRQPVMKSPIPLKEINELTRKLYKLSFSPGFLYHQISSIRSWADIKYLARAGKAVFGHLADFFS